MAAFFFVGVAVRMPPHLGVAELLRRILDSPAFYFTAAAILLVVAIASQFELQVPSRPKGQARDIEEAASCEFMQSSVPRFVAVGEDQGMAAIA